MTNTITFNAHMRELLRGAYERAVKAKRTEFTFQDQVFLTGYAKYLLMHLDNELKAKNPSG